MALPAGWGQAQDAAGRTYFLDHTNSTTTFVDPRVAFAQPLPPGWEVKQHASSPRPYYVDHTRARNTFFDPRIYGEEYVPSPRTRPASAVFPQGTVPQEAATVDVQPTVSPSEPGPTGRAGGVATEGCVACRQLYKSRACGGLAVVVVLVLGFSLFSAASSCGEGWATAVLIGSIFLMLFPLALCVVYCTGSENAEFVMSLGQVAPLVLVICAIGALVECGSKANAGVWILAILIILVAGSACFFLMRFQTEKTGEITTTTTTTYSDGRKEKTKEKEGVYGVHARI